MRFIPTRTVRRALGIAGTVAFGLAVTAAVSTIAGATQGAHQDDQQGGGAEVLAAEIASMEAGGLPADDPKVRMLQDDLDALERGRDVTPPSEPGIDMGGILNDAATRDAASDASDASLWDDGAVQCEVVPPDLLTAADIAGATCASTLDGDGGRHYTATGRDGAVRTVHFAPDGSVTREPDRHS